LLRWSETLVPSSLGSGLSKSPEPEPQSPEDRVHLKATRSCTWGMEEDTPVMMVDMVSTMVMPAGRYPIIMRTERSSRTGEEIYLYFIPFLPIVPPNVKYIYVIYIKIDLYIYIYIFLY